MGMSISKSWIVKKCKKIFYHLFNSVKYLYLPSDTFRKHVERHVTRRKLSLKLTGYCRQTSYTDSAVVFTLLPAVAWVLKSQFAPGYMHFNICFKGVSGKIGIFHNEKLPIDVFWFFCLSRSWQWAGANIHDNHVTMFHFHCAWDKFPLYSRGWGDTVTMWRHQIMVSVLPPGER